MIPAASPQIDIKENRILKLDKDLLPILLKDKTSGNNLLWATDNYEKHGSQYDSDKYITVELITGHNGNIIKPRTQKSKQEQQNRIRQKAEVFTPSWICNAQNNLIDEAWFSGKQLFNEETDEGWVTNPSRIEFSPSLKKRWTDYVSEKRMEISCGEAPYLTSRYDSVTGTYIPVNERIGLLDRKLRLVNENTETTEDWLKWAYTAVTSIYGFDWQGDNVLIARENILFTIVEHYDNKFHKNISSQDLLGFAKVIIWNIWQMDGIKFVIPNSCCIEEKKEVTLFEEIITSKACSGCKTGNNLKHNGIYCKIRDWETHQTIRFVDILKERK